MISDPTIGIIIPCKEAERGGPLLIRLAVEQLGRKPYTWQAQLSTSTQRTPFACSQRTPFASKSPHFLWWLTRQDVAVSLFSGSAPQLLQCFAWPDVGASATAEAQAGFAAVGSEVPRYLREIILDASAETGLSSPARLHLLEWCTALTALPCGGLKDPITLKLYEGADENDLPNVHPCTHVVHLPPYASRAQLRAKLLLAVEHRHDGFQIE